MTRASVGARWGVLAAALALAGCATVPAKQGDLVWPLPPEEPRVKYVESFSRRGHFGTRGSDKVKEVILGPSRQTLEQMGKPFGVVADPAGRIYVTDTGGGLVWIFDREKREVRTIGESGQGRLGTPTGITLDARGTIFVADARQGRVFAYDQAGQLVLAIGQKEELHAPGGVAVDPRTGRLYVSDTRRHKIRVYDSTSGQFLHEFGERGTQPGQFNYPTHLFLRRGRLYVSDTMNFRVQVLDLQGEVIRSVGRIGTGLGEFARPKGVAVDSEGHLYVVDAAFNNFQIFNGDGELLLFVGKLGRERGELWLPAGMFIDEQDRIYVVDQYNRRVQVFQYLSQAYLARARQAAGVKPQ